jgi:hypothetical protein
VSTERVVDDLLGDFTTYHRQFLVAKSKCDFVENRESYTIDYRESEKKLSRLAKLSGHVSTMSLGRSKVFFLR